MKYLKYSLAFCGLLASIAPARDVGFINAAGGVWIDASEWTGNAYPAAGDSIRFSGFAGGDIRDGGGNVASSLLFDSATRTLLNNFGVEVSDTMVVDSERSYLLSNRYSYGYALDPTARFSGSGTLIKNGGGAITPQTLTFFGDWIVNAGTININGGSLGTSVTLNGGALAMHEISGGELDQAITLGSGVSTLDGYGVYAQPISGAGSIRFVGTHLAKFWNTSDYTGSTYIGTGGGLQFEYGGQITRTSGIDVHGTLQVTADAFSEPFDRFGDNVPIRLSGGKFEYSTSLQTGVSERFGTLTVGAGASQLVIASGYSTPTDLHATSLQRDNRGTLRLTALGSSSRLLVDSASLLFGGGGAASTIKMSILPFATDNTNGVPDLLTIDNGVVRKLADKELSGLTVSNPQANGWISFAQTISRTYTCNALLLTDAASLSGSNSTTLTVSSGLIAGSNSRVDVPLNFGTHEGVLIDVAHTGPISGSGGLTIDRTAATGPATFSTSTYSGVTTINAGTVQLDADVQPNQPGAFGSDASAIVMQNGASSLKSISSNLTAVTPITFGRDLQINTGLQTSADATAGVSGPITLSGHVQLDGPLKLSGSPTVTGTLSGAGLLTIAPAANVTLSGNSDFTGGTRLNAASLTLTSAAALGSGTLAVQGSATLSATQAVTVSNPLVFDSFAGATLNVAGTHRVTFAGPVDLGTSTARINVPNTTLEMTGLVANGSLAKDGAGMLAMSQFAIASLTINGGVVQANANSPASRLSTLTLAAGAALDLTNNSLIVDYPRVNGGSSPSPLGTLRSEIAAKQITSSLADAHHGLGFMESGAQRLFAGQLVDSTSVLIAYAYLGDTNLDGKVDIVDLGNLAASWQQSGYWSGGDFNYDGKVDIVDLGALAGNWQAGATTLSSMSFADAAASVGLGAAVPEPHLLGLGLLGLILSRRRRGRD